MGLSRIKFIDMHGTAVSISGPTEKMKAAYEAVKESMEATDGTEPKVMEIRGVGLNEENGARDPMCVLIRPENLQSVYLCELSGS